MERGTAERDRVHKLSDEERTAIRAGMDAARHGDFVPEKEMDEFYRLHLQQGCHSGAREA
jgi:predicted transcriptional regulator